MKKKLIFATKALWIGGIETALVNLLNHFDYEKYAVTLLVLQAELDMREQIPSQCRVLVADREKTVSFDKTYRYCRLFHLTEEATHPSKLHKMMVWAVPAIKWVENRLYIRYIRGQMKEEHFDTCMIYSDVAAETAVRAVHADKYLMFYHHGAMRRVYHDEIGYRKSEKIIAVSQNQEKKLRQFRPKYAEKMITIHNLTDVEGIRRKAEEPIPEIFREDQFHIVTCGRVSREKGMDLAVEACAKLVEAGFDQIHWWIVGGGPAMQEVRDTIAELHMEQYVTMTGMKSNPYPYIRQASLYVQPSRFEGYPMTILEALVLGQPVISTDNNGAREILREGVTGLLRPMDAAALAEAVQLLMKNPQKLEQMRKNAEKTDFEAQNRECICRLEALF